MLNLTVGLLIYCALSSAVAEDLREQGDDAFRWREYQKAYSSWQIGAAMGDSEQQELIATLLLGPHAHAVKHQRYEGTRYLYRAAIGGRRTAMLKLSEALNKGVLGVKKLPDAAKCWSKVPVNFEQRLTCVAITDFQDRRARPSCPELALAVGDNRNNKRDGAAFAKLCLANKTPALLVPGLPPSEKDLWRQREYERRGIDWVITGDVYNHNFESFRERFNATIVKAIEAGRGSGYLDKLEHEIDASIQRRDH